MKRSVSTLVVVLGAASLLAACGSGDSATATQVLTSYLVSQAPSPTPSPSSTTSTAIPTLAAVSASAPRDWLPLASSFMVEARWAPDSQHVAVWRISEGLKDSPPSEWQIFDRAGKQVGSVTATGFAWSGPDTFVVGRSGSDGTTHESIVHLGSTTETPTAYVPIAMEPDKPCIASDSNGSYTVWLGGKESPGEDGHAMACSADGSEIAVIKLADGEGISGSLEVVSAATGSILWNLRQVELSGTSPVAFSSDGSHLLAGESLVDLSSGSVVTVPIAWVESGAWLPDSRVGVIAVDDDQVCAFDVAGRESSIDLPSGRYISVSPAGAIALIDDLAGTLRIVSNGAKRTIVFDCAPRPFLYWSPDGGAVVVACGAQTGMSEQAVLIAVP